MGAGASVAAGAEVVAYSAEPLGDVAPPLPEDGEWDCAGAAGSYELAPSAS